MKFRARVGSFCLTLGESDDPESTMSTEPPGASSTREGLRANTSSPSLEEGLAPRLQTPFLLEAEMGGRTERPDKPYAFRAFGRKPADCQYIR